MGGRYDRLHHVWTGMKDRCNNPNNVQYKNYGGRGIKVCEEWDKDYQKFKDFMISIGYDEKSPRGHQTLDRIDVNKGYCPENCRLISIQEQMYNRTDNRRITYNNITKTITEWSKEWGIPVNTISYRLNKGWDIDRIIHTPVKHIRKNH